MPSQASTASATTPCPSPPPPTTSSTPSTTPLCHRCRLFPSPPPCNSPSVLLPLLTHPSSNHYSLTSSTSSLQSRLELLRELESFLVGTPINYLSAYIPDLHHAQGCLYATLTHVGSQPAFAPPLRVGVKGGPWRRRRGRHATAAREAGQRVGGEGEGGAMAVEGNDEAGVRGGAEEAVIGKACSRGGGGKQWGGGEGE